MESNTGSAAEERELAERERIVAGILADPRARARLVAALSEDIEQRETLSWRSRAVALVSGLSSAVVVLLAFLIPSAADLWDRYQALETVARYRDIGAKLVGQRKYTAAEQAFDRALELAGDARHDLYEAKMRARVRRVEEDPEWDGAVPEDVAESDFLYLLADESEPARARERAVTLTSYGVFLAAQQRLQESERALREALALDPTSARPHVDLANVLFDGGDVTRAQTELQRALALEPDNAAAHYNLGLLLAEQDRPADAEQQFRSYTRVAPGVPDGFLRLGQQLQAQGKTADAREAYAQALHVDRTNREAKDALATMTGLERR